MRRALLFACALALVVLPACAGTDRPEGVVERWLISLNQGTAGRPEKYAPDALSNQILPNWRNRDPGDLDVIEVGKGRELTGIPTRLGERRYAVPYRVESREGGSIDGAVILVIGHLEPGPWRISGLEPSMPGLRVPSQGGPRIGNASFTLWLVAFGVGIALVLLTVGLMSAFGREHQPVA